MGGVHTLMEASVDMEVAARQMRAPVSLGLTITADGTTLAKLAPAQPIVSPVPPFYEAVVIPAAKRVVENLVFEMTFAPHGWRRLRQRRTMKLKT